MIDQLISDLAKNIPLLN